jgi:predicted RND superfamily exporter protein
LIRGKVPEGSNPSKNAKLYSHFFKSVTTAREVLGDLTEAPTSLDYDKAIERLKGWLVGPDGKQTCVVITLSDNAIGHFRDAIGRGQNGALRFQRPPGALYQAIAEAGIDVKEAKVGGPPIENVAIDEEGEKTFARLSGLATLLGLALAWWSLRSVRLTLIVFVCAFMSSFVALAIVYLTGEKMDAVMMAMPTLVYVLAVSGSVHIINYYRDAVKEGGFMGAPERALGHGWKPAVLCNVTTAIGLGSLYISDLAPIKKFGLYSAIGVMAMLGVLFIILPAALYVLPVKPKKREGEGHESVKEHAAFSNWIDGFWRAFGSVIVRHHAGVAVGCFLVIGLLAWGLNYVHTSIDLLKLFDPSAQVVKDYHWLQDRLGALVPMEVVVRFPPAAQTPRAGEEPDAAEDAPYDAARLTFLERLETIELIQKAIEDQFGEHGSDEIGRTVSAATFAPELPRGRNFARRAGFESRLESSRKSLEKSGYLYTNPDGTELWRVSIRVAAFKDVDYGKFVEELRHTIEPVMAAHDVRIRVLQELAAADPNGTTGRASVVIAGFQPFAPKKHDETHSIWTKHEYHEGGLLAGSLAAMLEMARVEVALAPAGKVEGKNAPTEPVDCVVQLNADAVASSLVDQHTRRVEAREASDNRIDISHTSNVFEPDEKHAETAYSGVIPIVYKAQRALLESLIESTFWSFVTITPLMMFITRSIRAGLLVMLPNILPVLVVFGGMGWMGVAVDIGSMMSASVALGVAVDDTIHFLTWFREDLDRLKDRNKAILAAYSRCATPTLQAALISGLGLSIFAMSTFTPTQRFGWLMLTILIAGVIAELVMLPALLAGPLGKVFKPRPVKGHGHGGHAIEEPTLEEEPVHAEYSQSKSSTNGRHNSLESERNGHSHELPISAAQEHR